MDQGISILSPNRRVPERRTLDEVIRPIYKDLLAIENSHSSRKDGMVVAQQPFTRLVETERVIL